MTLRRLPQVVEIFQPVPEHLYKLAKQGQFPAQVTVVEGGACWSEHEVCNWVTDRLAQCETHNHCYHRVKERLARWTGKSKPN